MRTSEKSKDAKIKEIFEIFNMDERIDKTLSQIFHAYPHANKLIEYGRQQKTTLLDSLTFLVKETFTEQELDEFLELNKNTDLQKWLSFFFSDGSVVSKIVTEWLEDIAAIVYYMCSNIDPHKLN